MGASVEAMMGKGDVREETQSNRDSPSSAPENLIEEIYRQARHSLLSTLKLLNSLQHIWLFRSLLAES